jgi:hypothetical protein
MSFVKYLLPALAASQMAFAASCKSINFLISIRQEYQIEYEREELTSNPSTLQAVTPPSKTSPMPMVSLPAPS